MAELDMDIVARLNRFSAACQNHGGITAEAADEIADDRKMIRGLKLELEYTRKKLKLAEDDLKSVADGISICYMCQHYDPNIFGQCNVMECSFVHRETGDNSEDK